MMLARNCLLTAGLFFSGVNLVQAASKCHLTKIADLPVTMNSLRPMVDVQFNDQPAKLTVDSGAFYSSISEDAAAEFGLKVHAAPFGFHIKGIGGNVQVGIAEVKRFGIVGVTIKNVEFLVGGSSVRSPGYVTSAGLLGQNLLSTFEVEYDLGTGMIRLFKSEGDCDKTMMAYWLKPGQSFSTMSIEPVERRNPHTIGEGRLNGQRIRIAFDTGAFTSLLSLKAAKRAGINPDSPGVIEAGYSTGLGQGAAKSYIGTFSKFAIGDGEEIQNAKLRFADLDIPAWDMLLGADFFISHHIFVATKERKLFLTYNGGAVFDLSKAQSPATQAEVAPGEDTAPTAEAPAPAADAKPMSSDELARLGSALVARRDFKQGIADLTRAIEQSPQDPEYLYQRANALRVSGRPEEALADYDKIIALKADFLPAYIPRAEIKFARNDNDAAFADLDTVARLAPKSADLRLQLGELYERHDKLPSAVPQFNDWIENHQADSRLLEGRAHRCWSNVLLNQLLDQALDDCSFALKHSVNDNKQVARMYGLRGLVRLRQGGLDKALVDFNDALKREPRDARALYGRGLVEAKKHQTAASDADLTAAEAADAELVARLKKYGFVP